jgi:hypothetical protein
MRYLFILFLFAPLMMASNILSTKIAVQHAFVDILITFDTPFEGQIRQNTRKNGIVIRLSKATAESPSIDKPASSVVKRIAVTPLGDETQIAIDASAPIVLQASKSSDAYGLKLRIAQPSAAPQKQAANPSSEFNGGYSIVAAVALTGIALFFLLMRRVPKPIKTALLGKKESVSEEATVRFHKPIDVDNSVALIDYAGTSYLVVLGATNLLLEKFRGDEALDADDLEGLFEAKRHEINAFVEGDANREEPVEPLESYKAKASGV